LGKRALNVGRIAAGFKTHSRIVVRGQRAEYPILERSEIADDVVRAIREEFPWVAVNEPAEG